MKKAAALLVVIAMALSAAALPGFAAGGEDLLKSAEFYLTFEDGVKDIAGKHTFKSEGTVPSVDGRFGKGIATDSADHFIYSDDVSFGADSWTLTSWVKIDSHSGDPVIFGNKDWNSGGNPGWLISVRDGDWKYNCTADGGSRYDFTWSFRDSVLSSEKGDWYHMALVVDRSANVLYYYVNGVLCLSGMDFNEYNDSGLTYDALIFTIGQDGTGAYGGGELAANFDEIALFRRALTADEVASVYTYAPAGYEAAVIQQSAAAADGKSANPAPNTSEYSNIITDGLAVYYDGGNNTGVAQDKNSAVWRDVSGNGYDLPMIVDGISNYWTDNSFHIDSQSNYFPNRISEIVNSEAYTVELALGKIEQPGTNWVSLLISDNDEFSLFVRTENDNLEYKYNDRNGDRPVAEDGANLVNDSTITVTFDINQSLCNLYVDGVLLYEAEPEVTNVANYLHLCSDAPERNWSGDVYAIRFYDRALTASEVAYNAQSDNERYRSGNKIVIPTFAVEEPAPVEAAPAEAAPAEAAPAEAAPAPAAAAPAPAAAPVVAAAPASAAPAVQTADGITIAVLAAVAAMGVAVVSTKKR